MHRISLVVSTLGEQNEDLRAFLSSLISQARHVREVIVVDQHRDPRGIALLLKEFQDRLPVRHTQSERGLSQARNKGLSLASGPLVAFPDDDCLYPEGLLEWVVRWFELNARYDILTVGSNDASGILSGNPWPLNICDIHIFNARRTTSSSTLFLRSSVARTARFDDRLETFDGSSQETDYVLQLIRAGAKARFDRTWHIIHPLRDMPGIISAAPMESYSLGLRR
jgi:glycosyltransferase involved in cell wall biosynthesis